MVNLITYELPNDNITKVEVSKAETIDSDYVVLKEISIKGKYYIDKKGRDYNAYKLRFYDTVQDEWADYTDPITNFLTINLCQVDDVKVYLDTVGKYDDKEIFIYIHTIEQEFLDEMGVPLSATYSKVGEDKQGDIGDTYYVGEENVYDIERVFYSTSAPQEVYHNEDFKINKKYGMIQFLTVASGGPELEKDAKVEIRYIPKLYHSLVKYRTLKLMIEKIDYADGEAMSQKVELINSRLEVLERLQNERVSVKLSSHYSDYDPVYGVNKKKVEQKFTRNKTLATRGWE